MPIPVLDIFAGPGGLGEGFSALEGSGQRAFKIKLSIEKDEHAHQTLEVRAFFRQFPCEEVPKEYYEHLRGEISRQELLGRFPEQAEKAEKEAWHAELGSDRFPAHVVDDRIRGAIGKTRDWVLIGGPPCQAYSLVGRSRRKHDPSFKDDEKHLLYRQYLRILAVHRPPVFVMENVKGLLSAKVKEEGILDRILSDLENPLRAIADQDSGAKPLTYRLVSLVRRGGDLLRRCDPQDFVVRTEDYGVPQARHRIILLGIRSDIKAEPGLLEKQDAVFIEDVIGDLPRLRSGLSKEEDNDDTWRAALQGITREAWFKSPKVDAKLRSKIREQLQLMESGLDRGTDFVGRSGGVIGAHAGWFNDPRLDGVCNHATRSHIRADLHRYFFVSAFASVHGRSPLLEDLPVEILPHHRTVAEALKETKFNDRFRVQRKGWPSTTITSHISKDGHYYVHYDPTQCRSLTVREAARLQTFPDNYFFEGPRTQQYHQVGNAVPPFLAHQIAKIVYDIFQ